MTEQCRNCEWSGDTDDLRWSSKCCDAEREDSNRCPECNEFASWNAVCPECGGEIETAAARAKREAELKRERNKPPLHFVTWGREGDPWPGKTLCGAAIEEDSDDWDYSPSPHMVDGKVHSTVRRGVRRLHTARMRRVPRRSDRHKREINGCRASYYAGRRPMTVQCRGSRG